MRRLLLVPAVLAAGCGGGGSSPTSPTAGGGEASVTAVVFYDENGNGRLDPGESVRLPQVGVQVGGVIGRTDARGTAVVQNAASGSVTAQVLAGSLPPYYQAGPPVNLTLPLPAGTQLQLPVTLDIGSNNPNTYVAFGDSITNGDGSSDGMGYRGLLQGDLQGWFGRAVIINEGVEGTRSGQAVDRIGGVLAHDRPAYTLIHYGTNDWNDFHCRQSFPCSLPSNLQAVVDACKAAKSLPVLATIIPANPAFPAQVPPQRNSWIHQEDAAIRDLARQEQIVLADMEAAFLKQGSLPQLFSDHIHPNDRGYQIMAQVFFDAITRPIAIGVIVGPQGQLGRRLLAPPRMAPVEPTRRLN